jgi:hypothetical protein
MTFAQRRNRLTTRFSERIPVVKRHMTTLPGQNVEFVTLKPGGAYSNQWALNGYTYLYVMSRSTLLYFARSQNCTKRLLDSSCLSVCLCVSVLPSARARLCLRGTTRFPLNGFSRNLIFGYFWKMCRENSSFIKIRPE